MTTPKHTIEVEQLHKRFGKIDAVNGISFKVEKGQIVGFLGPNGAGKSTTMRILTGYNRATSGIAKICGVPVAADPHYIKRRIGYMPENNPLPLDLRVREYLKYRAKMKEIPFSKRRRAINQALESCDLLRAQDRIIGKLSKGFRQRVGIADAILANPEVIIMDEPTIGLDPHQVILIRDLIASLRGRMTVIISSHILPEIEMTCDQIIIINHGKIVGQGSPAELRDTFIDHTTYEVEIHGTNKELEAALATIAPELLIERISDHDADGFATAEIRIKDKCDYGEKLFKTLSVHPHLRTRSLRRKMAPLEDVFLAATRRSWEEVDQHLLEGPVPPGPQQPLQTKPEPTPSETAPTPQPEAQKPDPK
ncbi:ABC transporter ATP-binding protein [Pelagicoccus sp. SDUM812002]|uniref:ABC transporter ATP-binding protein n=1 Tax=Pelagicoccus sp. SDUM812002 TaxID=3041266 RepID=UPI00280E2106|nr:ABC transporter ATP-binding protein [Pelagicoccus sp. SDUM812002]MDQ8185848.1 ABC transporter ATP-binding protein [Pelagicoccus sp. SDUM812002]